LLQSNELLATESIPRTRCCRVRRIFAPKAKQCIFLFMEGGTSQVDLFDPKPKLMIDARLPDSSQRMSFRLQKVPPCCWDSRTNSVLDRTDRPGWCRLHEKENALFLLLAQNAADAASSGFAGIDSVASSSLDCSKEANAKPPRPLAAVARKSRRVMLRISFRIHSRF